MARIVGAILTFALVFAIFKLVIIALVVAGLIFRTKETVGLLLIGGAFTLLAAFPVVGIALLIITALTAIVWVAKRERRDQDPSYLPAVVRRQLDDPDQE